MPTLWDYFLSCKPRIIALMLVTAWTGMLLASKSLIPAALVIYTSLGIACLAASAAILNHVLDRKLDIRMARTKNRPIASGKIAIKNVLIFSCILGLIGSSVLIYFVNYLTALLSILTLFAYGLIYTCILKPITPQNIVIGGLAGAMPPLLGWAAVSNSIHPHALLLVLIIFIWTPPHFWSLAIYRRAEYKQAHLPMLPLTHGVLFTKKCIVLYTVMLSVVTFLPYLTLMSGKLYLLCTAILNVLFLMQVFKLYRSENETVALKTFHFSITYLLLLFIALLLDHLVVV